MYRTGVAGLDFKIEEISPYFFEKSVEYMIKQANKKKTFFLYLALPSPYTPILPIKEFQGKSELNLYGDLKGKKQKNDDYTSNWEQIEF
ncbi:hypothetical protein [Flavobacterium ovatum]|uniref:hypothetical protein n=1 Tax=Flavobacterium ovatum TaxID=1928857 RepID=UPI0034510905